MSLTAYRKVVKQHTDETGEPPPDEAIASDDEDGNQINRVHQDAALVSVESNTGSSRPCQQSNLTKVLKEDLRGAGNSEVLDPRTVRQKMLRSEFSDNLKKQIIHHRSIHRPDVREQKDRLESRR